MENKTALLEKIIGEVERLKKNIVKNGVIDDESAGAGYLQALEDVKTILATVEMPDVVTFGTTLFISDHKATKIVFPCGQTITFQPEDEEDVF